MFARKHKGYTPLVRKAKITRLILVPICCRCTWGEKAAERLTEEGLTLSAIIANRPIAAEYMNFDQKQPKEHRPADAPSETD